MYATRIKPLLDRAGAALLLLVAAPLLLLLLTGLWASIGRPLFFVQQRPGYKGRLFSVFKLRTMDDRRGADNELLPDAERLHGMGRWIRSLSLDELPQLFNVLRGEMSFVGPRPLLAEYLPLYSPQQQRRHDVKPGITGWAQVNGRNAISWQKKFELDLYYVDHLSFRLDVKIMLLTLQKVFLREGINAQGSATAEKFNGYN